MLMPLLASAQTKVEIDGIWYNLTPKKVKQAEVTYKDSNYLTYGAYSGSINIPATVTYEDVTYSVTSIGDYAFYWCKSLTDITIPESVTSIGENAFSSSSKLTAITIPENSQLTSIGEYAFRYCSSLTAVHISNIAAWCKIKFSDYSSNPLYYAHNIYINGELVTQLTIPEGVTSIGSLAFYECSGLTAITIPESVTSIGEYAFRYCSSLTAIVLPKNLKNIYTKAFANCSELLDVYCYAKKAPSTSTDAFDGSYPKYITLHVPASALNAYKSTWPWSSFGKFETFEITVENITLNQSTAILTEGESTTLTATVNPEDADDTSVTWNSSNPSVATVDNTGKVTAIAPGTTTITATANDGSGVSASCVVEVKEKLLGKCAIPTISYVNEKVVFACDTEGVTFVSETTEDVAGNRNDAEFTIIPTYTITAYATKEHYENSDAVTLTLCWIPCSEEHEDNNGILNIPAKPVLISTQGGVITVSGLAAGTAVAAYSTTGTQLATATATEGTATLTTNLEAGSIAIVKIGEHTVKVVIK